MWNGFGQNSQFNKRYVRNSQLRFVVNRDLLGLCALREANDHKWDEDKKRQSLRIAQRTT